MVLAGGGEPGRSAAPPERWGLAGSGCARAAVLVGTAVMALALAPSMAGADWVQPDESYREAQLMLRSAVRDTVGHADDPARLDTLGVALLRLARFDDASKAFRRVFEASPQDDAARAGLGKLALFQDRPAEADSLLSRIVTPDASSTADLFAARVRMGSYEQAADMAEKVNQGGRAELLRLMAEQPPYRIAAGPDSTKIPFARAYPIPLVRVKLNGQSVLMALDTGAGDLLVDESAYRRCAVRPVGGRSTTFWCGSRVAVSNAMVQQLQLGGYRVEGCPAGVLNLGKWSLEVNPQGERVAGVIGLELLRRFTPTLDYDRRTLELRRPGTAFTPAPDAQRVPFQIWGESELTVFGTLAQCRPMAFILQTGLPGCGVGAPPEVFDEIGVRSGAVARLVKNAGKFLQGRPWDPVVVPTVTVGPLARDRVAGFSGALESGEMWRHGVRRDAILSGEFFRGQRLTIDWQRHELVIEEK